MPALTARELTDMKTHGEEYLTSTCKIEYVTHAKDAIGGDNPTWTSRGTAISCRLDTGRAAGNAALQASQLHEGGQWMLTLKTTQAVTLEDRVTIGGAVYRVTWVNDDDTERVLTRAAVVRTDL